MVVCADAEGIHKYMYKYDARGNQTEMSYYGVSGNPCIDREGVHGRKYKFDERNYLIENSSFGINGEPIKDVRDVYTYTYKNDEKGNRIEEAYLGVDRSPSLCVNAIAKGVLKYDNRGNMIERAAYGLNGEPVVSLNGEHILRCKYDARNNIIEESHYGTDGNLCLVSEGFAVFKIVRDERGRAVEGLRLGTDSLPVEPYREVWTLNKQGGKIKSTYYDKDNKLLGDYYSTFLVTGLAGYALSQNVPIGSLVLQFNDWTIGDKEKDIHQQLNRKVGIEYYILTPTGEIIHLKKDRAPVGLGLNDYLVEKSQAEEWRTMLETWKKKNGK